MDFKRIWERVKAIIAKPGEEWDKIIDEPEDTNEIFIHYAVPLIALGAITTFIGKAAMSSITGYEGFMLAISYFISTVVGLYVSAIVLSELAPSFDTIRDFKKSVKLIIYSSTPALAAAVIASLHPGLSFIGLFGFYSLYLFWLGLPKLLDTSEDKKVGFVLVASLIIIAIIFIINFILQSILIATPNL